MPEPLAGRPSITVPGSEQIVVEPWPAGGWVVRMEGHPTPISRHDTEEEARARAAAYSRGLERQRLQTDGGRAPGPA
ncbi:MAG: DUF2188 domain-containing protein [Solirubrobacteraceae bacterium]